MTLNFNSFDSIGSLKPLLKFLTNSISYIEEPIYILYSVIAIIIGLSILYSMGSTDEKEISGRIVTVGDRQVLVIQDENGRNVLIHLPPLAAPLNDGTVATITPVRVIL